MKYSSTPETYIDMKSSLYNNKFSSTGLFLKGFSIIVDTILLKSVVQVVVSGAGGCMWFHWKLKSIFAHQTYRSLAVVVGVGVVQIHVIQEHVVYCRLVVAVSAHVRVAPDPDFMYFMYTEILVRRWILPSLFSLFSVCILWLLSNTVSMFVAVSLTSVLQWLASVPSNHPESSASCWLLCDGRRLSPQHSIIILVLASSYNQSPSHFQI